jgi:hypothetical protein
VHVTRRASLEVLQLESFTVCNSVLSHWLAGWQLSLALHGPPWSDSVAASSLSQRSRSARQTSMHGSAAGPTRSQVRAQHVSYKHPWPTANHGQRWQTSRLGQAAACSHIGWQNNPTILNLPAPCIMCTEHAAASNQVHHCSSCSAACNAAGRVYMCCRPVMLLSASMS